MSPTSFSAQLPAPDILLIDNNPVFFKQFSELLRLRTGSLSVAGASSGQEALALEFEQSPRLVLLDIDLFPDQSGLSYLADLRTKWPESAIAMLSFHDSPRHQDAARAAGARAFISKWELEYDTILLTLQHLGIDVPPDPRGSMPTADGASAVPPL